MHIGLTHCIKGLLLHGGGQSVKPQNQNPPRVSGSATNGSVLSVSNGAWVGNGNITYTYQWKLAGVTIVGATSSTYTSLLAQVGSAITCVVTATNSAGNASATTSNSITVT